MNWISCGASACEGSQSRRQKLFECFAGRPKNQVGVHMGLAVDQRRLSAILALSCLREMRLFRGWTLNTSFQTADL
jgi:hypothetical protein